MCRRAYARGACAGLGRQDVERGGSWAIVLAGFVQPEYEGLEQGTLRSTGVIRPRAQVGHISESRLGQGHLTQCVRDYAEIKNCKRTAITEAHSNACVRVSVR